MDEVRVNRLWEKNRLFQKIIFSVPVSRFWRFLYQFVDLDGIYLLVCTIFWCVLRLRILAGTIHFHIRKSDYYWVFKIEKTHRSGSNFEFLSIKNVFFGLLLRGIDFHFLKKNPDPLSTFFIRGTAYWKNRPHIFFLKIF